MDLKPKHWRRRFVILLAVIAAFFIGANAQEQLGLSFSLEQVEEFRQWVNDLGWWGPLVFITLVIFRLFIGFSSHLMLILGGLVFGPVGGIIWGSLGLLTSSLVLFFLARQLGTNWVEERFGNEYQTILERIKRLGAIAIFALTAHPFGMLTPTHLAAGLVRINTAQFALAVALAAPIRAVPFVFFGTAILDLTPIQSITIAAVMLIVFGLPLLHPRVRSWIWGEQQNQAD